MWRLSNESSRHSIRPSGFSAQFGITQLMDPQFLQDQSEAGPLAALRFVGRLGPPLGPLGSLGKLGQ